MARDESEQLPQGPQAEQARSLIERVFAQVLLRSGGYIDPPAHDAALFLLIEIDPATKDWKASFSERSLTEVAGTCSRYSAAELAAKLEAIDELGVLTAVVEGDFVYSEILGIPSEPVRGIHGA